MNRNRDCPQNVNKRIRLTRDQHGDLMDEIPITVQAGATMESRETLTKADLANHLVAHIEMPKKDADLLVNAFLESIVKSLQAGEGVELRGFGSFRLRSRLSRVGRNPRSGEPVNVPAKWVVYFKLGKELRSKLIDSSIY